MQTPLPLFGSNPATPAYPPPPPPPPPSLRFQPSHISLPTHPPSPLPKMNATPAWKCLLHYAFMEHVQEYDSICTETELSNSLVCKYLRSQKLDMHSAP